MNEQPYTRRGLREPASGPFRGSRSRRGSALIAVVPVTLLGLSVMVAFMGTVVDTSVAGVQDTARFRAKVAAQNAASMAITELWGNFSAAGGDTTELWSLRAHLDGMGLVDQSAEIDKLGVIGQLTGIELSSTLDLRKTLGLFENAKGRMEVAGTEIERLDVYRVDEWDATTIVIEVDAVARAGDDGSSKEARASVQEHFTIAPPPWEGLDFALLANNVNCLLCHTTIDSAERFYNDDVSLAGSYDQVKVGSIDSIHFRSDPDSAVAGVVLIGGDAIEGDGSNIADWSAFNLMTGGDLDGLIREDGFLDVAWEQLSLFDPNAPEAFASVFLDHYEHEGATPYDLPDSFPSPFPDNGGFDPGSGKGNADEAGNRIIDDLEFESAVRGSNGTISGGNITVLDKSDVIAKQSDLSKVAKGLDGSISGTTEGNVYITGTKGQPIVLDGDVAIDGDVVLSGYVVGSGTIRARGNVYIPGDLMYLDRETGVSRDFGTAADGRANSLAVAAGGNIVIGDPFRPAWGEGDPTNGEKSGSFNFTMDELAIFNRQEWMKTQPTLPGESEKVQTGVKTSWKDEKVKEKYWKTVNTYKWVDTGKTKEKPIYKWVTKDNGKTGEYKKTWKEKVKVGTKTVPIKEKVKTGTKQVQKTRWVKTGNKIKVETPQYTWTAPELDNPYYVDNYTPRYYSFAEGSTIPIFNKDGYFDPATNQWKSDEYVGAWDSSKLSYADVDDKNDPYLYDASGNPKAVVSTIAPTGGWITQEIMEKIVKQSHNGNGDKTIEIDATLYSANSIMGAAPATKSPNTNGRLHVNGAIVAADVGILAPNGTQVNYDDRGARSLSITSDTGLTIERRLTAPLPNL